MSKQFIDILSFRPASEKLTPEMDRKAVLVLNPCDGYHVGYVFDFDGDIGIYTWDMSEMTPHDFYVAWALLPNSIELSEKFEGERKSRLY